MTSLERESQLTLLKRLYTECTTGEIRVAVISGGTACGKTELLEAFSAQLSTSEGTLLSATAACEEPAVPFSLVGQLFRSGPRSAATVRAHQVLAAAAEAARPDLDPDVADFSRAKATQELTDTLFDLAQNSAAPLVLCIDDLPYADRESLRCLGSAIRRLRSSSVLVLLTERQGFKPVDPRFQAELPHGRHYHRVVLPTLSPGAAVELLAAHVPAARVRAAECDAMTGGNPLLVLGLQADMPADGETLVAGEAYRRAVLTCLYRSGPAALATARSLAVLGSANTGLLAQLAGLETDEVEQVVDLLAASGLLVDGRFRLPAMAEAVLDDLSVEQRAVWHTRASCLLYAERAPVVEVARQVLAAKTACASVVPLLHEAAEQALSEGDAQLAVSCLRLAQQADDRGEDRWHAETSALLTRAEWRLDPELTVRHVPALSTARMLAAVGPMLWFGQVEDASSALLAATDRPAAEVRAMRMWAALAYPVAQWPGLPEPAVPPSLSLGLEAVTVMTDAARHGPDDRARRVARKILTGHRLDDRTAGPLLVSLILLTWAGDLAEAHEWSARLARRARKLRAPAWEAMFTAVLAEVSANRGELSAARDHGRRALELLPVRGWGVAVGLPLGTLVRVEAVMGNGEEATRYLRMPVPEVMFGSPAGLHYLRARGLHQHLSGQYEAALDDFETIGVLATAWGMDNPAFLPWRSDAAEACLRLERTDEARALATEQLMRTQARNTRLTAVAQRILACASSQQNRPERLAQVIGVLQKCPDSKLELAQALTDFACVQQQLGRTTQAKVALRSAHQIAKQCGAAMPGRAPSQEGVGEDADRGMNKLSEAEQRVATLAASGYSNRQISAKLFVTVSTVEQHLTKIYRKLQVSNRADLALGLYPDIAG